MDILLPCLQIAALIALSRMIWTDFLSRRIEVGWLILFGVTLGVWTFIDPGLYPAWTNLLTNLSFLLLFYLLTGVYFWVFISPGTTRSASNESIGQCIGLGDLLFLPTLAVHFPLRAFVLFLVVSFSLTLVGWKAAALFRRYKGTIPLVGTVGIAFILYSIAKIIMHGN